LFIDSVPNAISIFLSSSIDKCVFEDDSANLASFSRLRLIDDDLDKTADKFGLRQKGKERVKYESSEYIYGFCQAIPGENLKLTEK